MFQRLRSFWIAKIALSTVTASPKSEHLACFRETMPVFRRKSPAPTRLHDLGDFVESREMERHIHSIRPLHPQLGAWQCEQLGGNGSPAVTACRHDIAIAGANTTANTAHDRGDE